MREIIKYQLRDRARSFLLSTAILSGFNIVSILMTLAQLITGLPSFGAFGGLFAFFSFFSAIVLPVVYFFSCGNGHIYEILYKPTNYLVLTVPRRGTEILGGRMIAGLLEYLALSVVAGIFLFLNLTFLTALSRHDAAGFAYGFRFFLDNVVVNNGAAFVQTGALFLFYFVLVGSIISFVAVTASTFIKNKTAAIILSAIASLLLFERISALGSYLSRQFNLESPVSVNLSGLALNSWGIRIAQETSGGTIFSVPLVSVLLFLCISAGLFMATAYLIENKVEL
jgi:hypothetical protein